MNPLCADCNGQCCRGILMGASTGSAEVVEGNLEWARLRNGRRDEAGNVVVPCRCSALGKNGRCTIYANRPLPCREFEVGGAACLLTRRIMGMDIVPCESEKP